MNHTQKTKKYTEYALKIISHLEDVFNDPENENYIEIFADDDANDLIHALSNIVPAHFFNKLSGQDVSILEHNHIANTLICQFLND